jgi:hypothetical protein
VPAGCLVRSLARFAYFERIGEPSQNDVIHRGPAMLLPIVAADGKFSGLHATYLDLAQPGGKVALKHPDTGEALPAKKVRGSKTGGRIEIHPVANPHTLIIGEGFETVLSVYQAHVAERRPIDGVAFWAAVDLGNLGGRAIETVPHPTLKTKNNRAQRVPGPVPDLDAPGIPIPESVERIVILGDGDSDRYTTACAIVRASARFAMPTRTVGVAWAPAGKISTTWRRIGRRSLRSSRRRSPPRSRPRPRRRRSRRIARPKSTARRQARPLGLPLLRTRAKDSRSGRRFARRRRAAARPPVDAGGKRRKLP